MAMAGEFGSRADFFVHPDFYRLGCQPITEVVEQYEAALISRIGTSPLPILIYDPFAANKGDFWDLFPSEQRFRTIHSGGNLNNDPMTRPSLNQLLSEREVLAGVVHGSYLGACVNAFRNELRAQLDTGTICVRTVTGAAKNNDAPQANTVKFGAVLSRGRGTSSRLPIVKYIESGLPAEFYAEGAKIFVVD
jgi:hypothetical protein